MNIEMTSPDLKKLSYVKINSDSITITKTTTRFEMFVIFICTLAVSLTLSLMVLNYSNSKLLSILTLFIVFTVYCYVPGNLKDIILLNRIRIDFSNKSVTFETLFNTSKYIFFNNYETDVVVITSSGRAPTTKIILKISSKQFLIMRYDTEYNVHHPEALLLADYINGKLGYKTIAKLY